ncbi:MAG: hypothetical protein KAG61_13385 [Bacteriovoracaceae bacterium]|nr:hypothetical protein [Bacteriovoracaceae bacterium]
MNLSLKRRVEISFIVTIMLVLSISALVFNYLDSLNKEIEQITVKSNRVSSEIDNLRISAISILKYQRKILSGSTDKQTVDRLKERCETFSSQLQTLDAIYDAPEVKIVIIQMLTYVDSLMAILNKASLFYRDTVGISSVGDLADKILESFSEFQKIQYDRSVERDIQIKSIIKKTKQNMMIVLIIGFFVSIILGLIIPGKIALPFKKIKDAIRELQDCNFDVSIYYNQDDEIGEISHEMNKMIYGLKQFEELRTNRITVENRKFDALANLVRRPVLVADAEGKLRYMNNKLYSLLQVQSEDVIDKAMTNKAIPQSIIDCYEMAIKRRSKIENAEIVIKSKKQENVDGENPLTHSAKAAGDDTSEIIEKALPEIIYEGYANVIPIRGKESSLDYYLMVLSTEVFV